MNKANKLAAVKEGKIVAVLRGITANKIVSVVRALHKGGIKAVEITFDHPEAETMVSRIKQEFSHQSVIVGAGTVIDAATAVQAIQAGAEFVVSPNFDSQIVKVCNRYGKVAIPGALTPTEIITAYQAGADLVKLFPAVSVGSNYLKKIKGPLAQVPIIPTGGINENNIEAFMKAGAECIGVGSALVDEKAVKEENYELLTTKAEKLLDNLPG